MSNGKRQSGGTSGKMPSGNVQAGKTPMDVMWDDIKPDRATGDPSLVIDVAGFEGPLDLLLHLARTQRVDLARISVLALAEQYLLFVEKARALRLELAADYLVMAAWLAYLKSKLLIPQGPKGDEPSGEEMAAQLAFRLKRLEAMREAASKLVNRNRLRRIGRQQVVERRVKIKGLVDDHRLRRPTGEDIAAQTVAIDQF